MAAKRRLEGKDKNDPTLRVVLKEKVALTEDERQMLADFLTKFEDVEVSSFKGMTTFQARRKS